jgi:hypothetical protein
MEEAMDPIGQPANRALQRVAKASQTSQSDALAKSAKRDRGGLPAIFDQEVDRQLQTLISFRHNNGAVELRRPLTADERGLIEARTTALELAIEPYSPNDRPELEGCMGTMFAGFRSMRQQGATVDNTIMITLAMLREFPAWAIQKACLMAATDNYDPRWPPNDAEIVRVTRSLVQPYRDSLLRARKLLEAQVQ